MSQSTAAELALSNELETPRLRLIRLTDTSMNSQHLVWFHRLWTDEATTAWSLHGPCHSLEESQEWMTRHMTEFDSITYAVFARKDACQTSPLMDDEPGELVGNVGLRRLNEGLTLPPPPPPAECSNTGSMPKDASKTINFRALGYAYFRSAWGKGYATEAGKAVVDAYSKAIEERKGEGRETFYLEASWDKDNPASRKVLEKLGFKEVGWKEETEKVFLAGAWRDPGYWVWGMYL